MDFYLSLILPNGPDDEAGGKTRSQRLEDPHQWVLL